MLMVYNTFEKAEAGQTPVEHFITDLNRSFMFSENVEHIRQGQPTIDQYTEYRISHMIYLSYQQYPEEIEKMKIFRALSDIMWVKTSKIYKLQLYLYLFGFLTPFCLQMMYDDPFLIGACLCMSSLVALLMILVLSLKIDHNPKLYFSNYLNSPEWQVLILFFIFVWFRSGDFDNIRPGVDNHRDPTTQFIMSINVTLVLV